MNCPECGTALATYQLDGREASVCERCGYVGIEAEHGGEGSRVESWTDALRRFYDEDDDLSLPVPQSERPDGAADESWGDALRRFYAARTEGDEGLVTLETGADADDTGSTGEAPTPARVSFDGRSVVGRGGDETEPAPAADGAGTGTDTDVDG